MLALLCLVAATHAPILRGLARALIADEPMQSADWALVLRPDRRFDRVAELYRSGAISGVLVMDRPANRLVRLGVIPSMKEQCLRELRRRGVGSDRVSALPGSDESPWQVAHALQTWLVEHPGSRVLVLCEQFKSGDLRFVVSTVMEGRDAERVALRGLPDRRYDESNWWKSRAGVRAFGEMVFDLAYDCMHGEDMPPAGEVDLDQFERNLLHSDHLNDRRP